MLKEKTKSASVSHCQSLIENQPSVRSTPPRRVQAGHVAIRQEAGRRKVEESVTSHLFFFKKKNIYIYKRTRFNLWINVSQLLSHNLKWENYNKTVWILKNDRTNQLILLSSPDKNYSVHIYYMLGFKCQNKVSINESATLIKMFPQFFPQSVSHVTSCV